MGSSNPFSQAPGALATVKPTEDTVPSAHTRLFTAPKCRYPPLPSSRLYRFQKSLSLCPTAAKPTFELLRSEERRVGKECRPRWWGGEWREKGVHDERTHCSR